MVLDEDITDNRRAMRNNGIHIDTDAASTVLSSVVDYTNESRYRYLYIFDDICAVTFALFDILTYGL
jgi:hypothetical protein